MHEISWKIDTFLHLVRKRYYENPSNKLNPVKHANLVIWLLVLCWLKPYPESFHHLCFCLHSFTALNHEQTITAHFSANKQHTCVYLLCACLYILHWVITWHVATKTIYVIYVKWAIIVCSWPNAVNECRQKRKWWKLSGYGFNQHENYSQITRFACLTGLSLFDGFS